VAGGVGGEAGYVRAGKSTELGAVTDNDSFGGGPTAVFSLEFGYLLAPRHRVSLLLGMGDIEREFERDQTWETEGIMTARLFARYAYLFDAWRVRPYLGLGAGWAYLAHSVRTDTGERTVSDLHRMNGVFSNFFVGVSVCLVSSCRVTAFVELNEYWNAWNSDGEDDSVSNFALHGLAGVGVHF